MSNTKNTSQLILCGPIVRRVEPKQAAIWLALQSAAKVKFTVWKGKVEHKNIGDTPKIGEVEKDTVAIGEKLHMIVVNLELQEENLLEWGELYSYNLSFTTAEGTKDLNDLGLISVPDEGQEDGLTPLSYEAGFLPSFMLAAKAVEDLKVLHGSCRNNETQYEDALAWADDFIKKSWGDTEKTQRPQQLFLSGDQIYADSVIGELLNELQQWGCTLLNEKEKLPTLWPNPATKNRWPADREHFPPYIRRRLIDSEARFTTSDTANHLISFGEFAAMYMSVWSDALWTVDLDKDEGDNIFQNFEDIFHQIKKVPENFGAIFRRHLTDERAEKEGTFKVDGKEEKIKYSDFFEDDIVKDSIEFLLKEDASNTTLLNDKKLLKALLTEKGEETDINTAKNKLKAFLDTKNGVEKFKYQYFFDYFKEWIAGFYPAFKEDAEAQKKEKKKKEKRLKLLHETLPKVRRALANISTFMIFDDHEVTDDWYLNPSWRHRVLTAPLGRTIIRNALMAYALFQDWGNQPQQYDKDGAVLELEATLATELDQEQLTDTLKTAFKDKNIELEKEKVSIKKRHNGEWLMKNAATKDEFVIRKYKEKEGEGEEATEKDILKVFKNPKSYLLQQIPKLFLDNENLDEVEKEIDFLLGFQDVLETKGSGRQQLPDNRSPLIKWHFTYEGAKHKVLAIDNRTRRSYVSFAGAPGNLSFNAMTDLIPENPEPKDDEVVFVVAPLPVLGPSTLDELVAPIAYRVFDVVAAFKNKEEIKSGMKGTHPDAIEAWVFDPLTQEELLKRLAPFKKIIFLSGDVHYGSSQRLHYWKKGEEKPSCFAQLTSSGLRNVMPSYIQYISKHFAVGQKLIRGKVKAERLGWNKNDPKPLTFEKEEEVPYFLKHKLESSPVIIGAQGWPTGTKYTNDKKPDWAWRIHNVLDVRKNEDRPSLTQIKPVFTQENEADRPKEGSMDAIRAIARRHYEQMKQVNFTRQILFKANIGLVTFEKTEGEQGVLQVIHNLYAAPYDGRFASELGATEARYDLYAVHKIPLEAPEEKIPELNK